MTVVRNSSLADHPFNGSATAIQVRFLLVLQCFIINHVFVFFDAELVDEVLSDWGQTDESQWNTQTSFLWWAFFPPHNSEWTSSRDAPHSQRISSGLYNWYLLIAGQFNSVSKNFCRFLNNIVDCYFNKMRTVYFALLLCAITSFVQVLSEGELFSRSFPSAIRFHC